MSLSQNKSDLSPDPKVSKFSVSPPLTHEHKHRPRPQPTYPAGSGPLVVPVAKSIAVCNLTEGLITASERLCCVGGKNSNQIFKKLISVCAYQVKWTALVHIYALTKHTHNFHGLFHLHSSRRPRSFLSHIDFTTDICFFLCLVSIQGYSDRAGIQPEAASKKIKYEEASADTRLSFLFITHHYSSVFFGIIFFMLYIYLQFVDKIQT